MQRSGGKRDVGRLGRRKELLRRLTRLRYGERRQKRPNRWIRREWDVTTNQISMLVIRHGWMGKLVVCLAKVWYVFGDPVNAFYKLGSSVRPSKVMPNDLITKA